MLLPEQAKAEYQQVKMLVARYSTPADRNVTPHLGDHMLRHLQSVVIAAEVRDMDVLQSLQAELWHLLSPMQNDVLRRITVALAR